MANELVESIFDYNETRVHYKRIGSGAHNVLFTTGTLGSCDDFAQQMQSDGGWDLSQFTLVSWCPPGYGHSRPPDRRVNADMNKHDANCALALMQHLGLLPFSVVGWSEGGRTCTHLAYTAPKHVRKIVIFSSVLVDTDELYRIFQRARETNAWAQETQARMIEMYGESYFRSTWQQCVDVLLNSYEQMGGALPCNFLLKSIKQPALFLHGTKDQLSNMTTMVKNIKNAKLIEKLGGEHDLQTSSAQWFNRNVQQFLLQ